MELLSKPKGTVETRQNISLASVVATAPWKFQVMLCSSVMPNIPWQDILQIESGFNQVATRSGMVDLLDTREDPFA